MADLASSKSEFESLLVGQLIPEYFHDPSRAYAVSAFHSASTEKISDFDAKWFLRGWNSGLLEHKGRGLYRAPRSFASEQFFWNSSAKGNPPKLTLWLEPVITVAAIGRLHLEFGWPRELLGTQSEDWAFDVTTFLSNGHCEHIACEVKKTIPEVEALVELMTFYGGNPEIPEPPKTGKERNAYKKVAALRKRQAPIFWAVGPSGYSLPFIVAYSPDKRMTFAKMEEAILKYPGPTAQ